MIGTIFKLLLGFAEILIIGLIVEKWMDKKGKGENVKNINYYMKRGNSLPMSILKAIAAGYLWLFKVQLKIMVIALIAFFAPGDGRPTEEELLWEEEEEILRQQKEKQRMEEEWYWMQEEEKLPPS